MPFAPSAVVFASLYPGIDVGVALLMAALVPFLLGLGFGACLFVVAYVKKDNKAMAHVFNAEVLLAGVLALSILWAWNTLQVRGWAEGTSFLRDWLR